MRIMTESSKKVFSRFGGLTILQRTIRATEIGRALTPSLPPEGFHGRTTPAQKFLSLVSGLACGADCLDDMESLAQDAGFEAACGETISSHRYSEFLAAFDSRQLRELQTTLVKTSLAMRSTTCGLDEFTLCVDSTKHEQFGLRQEGVEWSYATYRCRDSLHAYDNKGFPYWYEVRSGETHTSSGAEELLSGVFRELPKAVKKRTVLADSGYYSKSFFNACTLQGARFIVAMRANIYGPLLERSLKWNRAPSGMTFFDGRDFEFAETVFHPVDCQRTLRAVIVRALKPDHSTGLFVGQDYDYAAFVTDIGMHEMKAEAVLKKYRERSNTENFVREMKNGIDTRRFQFKRLVSCGAFALAAAFAHAFIRFIAHVADKNLVQFSKRIRNRLLFVPCQVIRHGREVVLRMNEHHYREVTRWQNKFTHMVKGFVRVSSKPDHGFLVS